MSLMPSSTGLDALAMSMGSMPPIDELDALAMYALAVSMGWMPLSTGSMPWLAMLMGSMPIDGLDAQAVSTGLMPSSTGLDALAMSMGLMSSSTGLEALAMSMSSMPYRRARSPGNVDGLDAQLTGSMP